MYLKQIEIHGFKSFANDTILNFEKGITAIVGPNGSGKSNIADAVRWVLGEQKVKQLRSTNMQDVIFQGTEMKKAQGFAYVSLIIDNSDRKLSLDFDEVKVSRRLYRSGDSEYKLNGAECRLKDINEVFYDTGIGKEGYSIIGQGQIDKILSNKPEDRRELFDEAAGIVKYKRRKLIAEKKLEEEKQNLSRVTDIMNELERQVEPLRKQSETAKIYLNLRDELIVLESNYFVREIDKETENIKNMSENLNQVKEDLKEVNEKKEEFNKKYAEIDIEISDIDLKIATLKDEISDVNTKKESYIGKINVINEQINFENESSKDRTDRIDLLNKYIFDILSKIENNAVLINTIKKNLSIIKNNSNDIEEENNIATKIDNIDKTLDDVIENVKNYMGDDYLFDINTTNENDNQLLSSVNEKKVELENLNTQIDSMSDEIKELNDKINTGLQSLENLNNDIIDSQSRFHALESKFDTIKNMIEKYEGYTNTVKVIMDRKDSFTGIKGVVADIISTKPEYEVAIEVALGASLQNVVMSNIEDSKNIIEYLKREKLGRVTLLPLTSLTPKDNSLYVKAKAENGVVDIAKGIVNYDSEYEVLAEYLLSRCIIVDNFDNANLINKKYNFQLKIVTLSGEIFNPGGSIAGGAYKNSLNLLGRSREYEQLKIEIENTKNDIDRLNEKRKLLSEEYDKNHNDYEQKKEELNDLFVKKNAAALNIVNELKLKYSGMLSQFEYCSNDLKRLYTELSNYFDEKNQLEDRKRDSEYNVDKKNDEINAISNEIENLNKRLSEINESINNDTDRKNTLLGNRKEYYESKDKIATEQISLEQEAFKLSSNIDKSSQKIQELTQKNFDEYEMTYDSAKEKYTDEYDSINTIKTNLVEIRKKIQALGNININAIEEYKEISNRYGLMMSQYEDLKKSEELILNIVADLDENMKKQFEENFKFIKKEFDKVFKELFGGGKATLELIKEDNENELEAGVQIAVQPPGKKLGNLSQLSGGERALTAIALLFAIQNLKPSPFCLLDEIEAALDESNVDRFSDYLKHLTCETQFILITHRRGTMENADRLYGVTMQEKGVTALVSVNLVEDQIN